jgi:hypothetical protein
MPMLLWSDMKSFFQNESYPFLLFLRKMQMNVGVLNEMYKKLGQF